ncbi:MULTISPECIES: HPr family phosphocarrier protein [Paenarthrobacter]|uniref:HPr family phosphocarrier protein n=1 Tax=Paenarthrobacter TaxID=1742992 RepID=UPI00140C994C|nr:MULTISPECIES: HPr family phosphocarrier protein [Paenarthrobacter]MCX8453819.1 HPr family phosphocarrier protein [Paenarthrobacter ureafaciens]MCY0971816.1 HPr family phosphocarrier protein [Paenarthrobacter ureafaciens]QOT17032.1 HPr family phosphocarrier protein [Paenarthrobacter sp. YJN-5]QQQ60882.1 HPr family phosphocarrier protein [Paenarthrobacter ureafaciens]UOD79613.1 HPr family phosphocarrier protein [Paenarthrobacter ureafaciens]
MPQQHSFVAAEIGLHARAAAVFVRAVNETGLPVTIRKPDGLPVDARSLLQVMTEDFAHGCQVVLEVDQDELSGHESSQDLSEALERLSAVLEAS